MNTTTNKGWRGLGAAILAVSLLTGCGAAESTTSSPGGKTTQISVALGFLKNVQYAGNWIADDTGLYAKAGLEPTFLAGGPNAPAPEVSLASGQAVIGYESNTERLFQYLAKANDIVIIGQRHQTAPTGLLSLASHPVTKASDLRGAKIIAGSANRPTIDALMKINGVSASDYTFIPGSAEVGSLMAKQGDALLANAINQPLTLQTQFGFSEGRDYFFTPFSKLGMNVVSDVVLVTRAYLESHREEVIAFMTATIQGWKAQGEDPNKGAELAVDKYGADLGLNIDQQVASAKIDMTYMNSDFSKSNGIFAVDPDYIANKVYPALKEMGIANLPEAKTIVDTTVLQDVYKNLDK